MKRLSIIVLLCLSKAVAFAQTIDAQTNKTIDSIVNAHLKGYSIVGLSIGIVHKGFSATKSYGATDASGKYPITDSTMFHLASISKLFTATAILQLVQDGKIRLADRLADLLPAFKRKDAR